MDSNKVEQGEEPLIAPKAEQFLNAKQVNYAIELVEQNRKLEKIPIDKVWPFLRYICCCLLKRRKKSFSLALKSSLRRKLDMSIPKSDLRIEEDPYLQLGYGMNAYFQIVLQLMCMVFCIMIITVPIMMIYSSHDALAQQPGYSFNQYTLGNFGGSDALCAISTFESNDMTIPLTCPTGNIQIASVAMNTGEPIFDAGIIQASSKVSTVCTNAVIDEPNLCSPFLDQEKLKVYLVKNCVGKDHCILENLNYFVMSEKDGFNSEECSADNSLIFIQVACIVDDNMVITREEQGLLVGCSAVFIALFVINYIDYIKKTQENNYVEWDIKTITAGDYAIEFDIQPEFFEDYLLKEYSNWITKQAAEGYEYLSRVQSFQGWIQNEMEERLRQLPNLGYDEVESVEIAVTTFAFRNQQVINLLKKRGLAIKNEKWEEQRKLEVEINKLKDEKFKELITPCSVFMTFETEEGVKRALQYDEAVAADDNLEHLKLWLGRHTIEIQQASEPTDIIWENRHFTPTQRKKKECVVWTILFFMLFVSFIVIYTCESYSNSLLQKYPPRLPADCEKLSGYGDDETFLKQTIFEYKSNTAMEELGKDVSYSGYVQCFCDTKALDGDAPDQEYDGVSVCHEYIDSLFPTLIFTNGIMVLIITINIVLRTVTVKLITWIGYDTYSEQMTRIINGVFIVLFFNTGILLLLVNANLSDVSGLLGKLFDGRFYDYSPQWYVSVGDKLVQTMLLNAFMPPIFEAQNSALTWFEQARDSKKFCCCGVKNYDRMYATRKKQLYELIDLYNGPDYISCKHVKYSQLLNVTYVTMFYGLGLPTLFPIALLSYFIFWCTERYQLAYCFQLPPAMDDKMTVNAMKLLSYTPILFLFNGYWMLSNRQIYENVINQIEYSTMEMSSSHWWGTLTDFDQATPMLILTFAFIFIVIGRICFYSWMLKYGYVISSNEIDVDEDLPNFYEAIKLRDADWFVKENDYCKDKYKFAFANEESSGKLDNLGVPKKPIQGIAWYNVLANPFYFRAFNYITVSVEDREDYIIDDDSEEGNDCEQCDMVSILINLAYVKQSVAHSFQFEAGYSERFGRAVEDAIMREKEERMGNKIN